MGLRSIELFAGVGMLGEGLRAGLTYLGVTTRTVCFVEREAHAAGVLAARIQEGSLDAAPVWSDVCTFDAGAWSGRVDCVVAGFPCQDLSVAGKRAGLDGQRSGLFFEVVRIAADSGAWLMFLENVAGIASATASVVDAEEGELDERAAARVVGELADLGWDAEWITLAASDVGASHGRARWFCLAWRVGHAGLQHQQLQQRADGAEHPRAGDELDDANGAGRGSGGRGRHDQQGSAWGNAALADAAVADTGREQRQPGHEQGGPGRAAPAGHQGDDRTADGGFDLADAERRSGERWREPGDLARTGREVEGEGHQRQRGGTAADGGDCAVADSNDPRSSRAGLRQSAEIAFAGNDYGAMAYASEQRPQEPAGGGHARPHEQPHGLAEPVAGGDALPLFAPGPTDPRWPAILAERPELAPALEPAFRSVADGLAFDMGDSRAARLKCVGNGVVAAQAGCAFVVLARRAAGVRRDRITADAGMFAEVHS